MVSSKIIHTETIFFNRHLLRNANVTYHDEMGIISMYLKSEIVFVFILAYFILFFGYFQTKHLFGFIFFNFQMYIMYTASKSLKEARNIVLLSHFVSKGLTKYDIIWLQGFDVSYFMRRCIPCSSYAHYYDNIT